MTTHAWQPTATIATLKQRAILLGKIRAFFAERNIFEVETPLLCHSSVTALHLHSFKSEYLNDDHSIKETLYLQTSPEYAMKRLLSAGSGSIYQICKAFRNAGESGRMHNPEFTMLEWYHPGFNHHDLMNEMDELLQAILNTSTADRFTYTELFVQQVGIAPHIASIEQLQKIAADQGINEIAQLDKTDKDNWLFLLMSHIIEPKLGQTKPVFIYDFPASQAALAKIRQADPPVAERFEVYYKGVELANGFHELSDAKEQHARFLKDLEKRKAAGYPSLPIDKRFLAGLEHGLPDCAGVAVGIDRLIMLAIGLDKISEVIAFPVERA